MLHLPTTVTMAVETGESIQDRAIFRYTKKKGYDQREERYLVDELKADSCE